MSIETESNDSSTPTLLYSPAQSGTTHLEKFIKAVNQEHSLSLKIYSDLHAWSVKHPSLFWAAVWNYCKIISSVSFDTVFESEKRIDQIPKWFLGAKLNYAENMLQMKGDSIAIVSVDESGKCESTTRSQLRRLVYLFSEYLRSKGVGKGDVVVGYVPNCLNAVVGMLGAISIGAIWASASPDFGVSGVLERFKQIQPKGK